MTRRVVVLHPADHVGKWWADSWRTVIVNYVTKLATQERFGG